MKIFAISVLLFYLLIPSMSNADDFWEKCPGPACPLNSPEFRELKRDSETNHSKEKYDDKERDHRDIDDRGNRDRDRGENSQRSNK